jgi:pimeloyl-ACP methyl ester carboxylesterase
MVSRDEIAIRRGGETLAATVYRPRGRPRCCVAMAPGLSLTRGGVMPALAEAFAGAGHEAVVFDYAGFGDSTGEPRQLLDPWRQRADCDAVLADARARHGGAMPTVLWGYSFGGGHALDRGSRDRRIAAVIAVAPLVSLVATAARIPLRANAALTRAAARDARAAPGGDPLMVAVVAPAGGEAEPALLRGASVREGFASIAGADWRNEITASFARRCAGDSPGRRARRIAAPALLCVPDHDQVTPPRAAAAAAGRMPRGQLRRYRHDHFGVLRSDDPIADQLQFLDRELAE